MKTIHFLNSLPRSGSTLLANILAQNPRFHSTPTSGCLDVLFSIRNNWDKLNEHQANPCPQKLQNVLRSAFYGYYADVDKPVVFDKSRGWTAYIEMTEQILNRKAKILTTVRPVVDILASFEMLHRETSKTKQPPGEKSNYFQFQTIKGRCDYWMRNDQVVGLALSRLQDVIKRGYRDRLCIIDFDSLTSKPKETMMMVYDFLEEKYFNHDFNYVEQVTKEDDEIYGYVNLHKIRNKVEPIKSRAKEILGDDLVKIFSMPR